MPLTNRAARVPRSVVARPFQPPVTYFTLSDCRFHESSSRTAETWDRATPRRQPGALRRARRRATLGNGSPAFPFRDRRGALRLRRSDGHHARVQDELPFGRPPVLG